MTKIPHLGIVLAATLAAIAGYAAFSIWAFYRATDAAMVGDIVGTWKGFATAAFFFWLGSSSGGKAKDTAPTDVNVVNTPADPVPTTTDAAGLAAELKEEAQ
jgi:hypothetical protein